MARRRKGNAQAAFVGIAVLVVTAILVRFWWVVVPLAVLTAVGWVVSRFPAPAAGGKAAPLPVQGTPKGVPMEQDVRDSEAWARQAVAWNDPEDGKVPFWPSSAARVRGLLSLIASMQSGIATLLLDLQHTKEKLRQREAELAREKKRAEADLAAAKAETQFLDEYRRLADCQAVGLFAYVHPMEDSVAYAAELKRVRDRMKTLCTGTPPKALAGTAKGLDKKQASAAAKALLANYNLGFDAIVSSMKPYTLDSTRAKADKLRLSADKAGEPFGLRIASDYHALRVGELELVSDWLAKKAEEAERVKAERERQREDKKATEEMEAEKRVLARLAEKERAHYANLVARLKAGDATEEQVAEAKAKLDDIEAKEASVEGRLANQRAGYVYVISNTGAFGEDVVKVGLTRRLEPEDRIAELSGASVPFRFDTHALVFSEDAVALETKLHRLLEPLRVNLVNGRKEFYRVKPADVRKVLEHACGKDYLVEFHETADAPEWRASTGEARNQFVRNWKARNGKV